MSEWYEDYQRQGCYVQGRRWFALQGIYLLHPEVELGGQSDSRDRCIQTYRSSKSCRDRALFQGISLHRLLLCRYPHTLPCIMASLRFQRHSLVDVSFGYMSTYSITYPQSMFCLFRGPHARGS
jgi:hypothetical protein